MREWHGGTPGQPARRQVAELARAHAEDPGSVVEVVHEAFNADPVGGGYAFRVDDGMLTCLFDGTEIQSWLGDERNPIAIIEGAWRDASHRHRSLGLDEMSALHRAAIAALVAGYRSTADLPGDERPIDVAAADYLLVRLRRVALPPTVEQALRCLAADHSLLAGPGRHDRAHACPVCRAPAIGDAALYVSVCDRCYEQARCSDGRLVAGYNTSFGGGFVAMHAGEDEEECAQVTGDGRVWIGQLECQMGEARLGGVFVGALPTRLT